jgi:hypothetical protein
MIRKSVERFSEKIMRICNGSDGDALCNALRKFGDGAPKIRVAARLKKPAAGFPARARIFFAMLNLCR